jgi:hypothetical protein
VHEGGGCWAQIFKRDDGGTSYKNEEIAVVAVDMEPPQNVGYRTHKVNLIGFKMRDPRLPQELCEAAPTVLVHGQINYQTAVR